MWFFTDVIHAFFYKFWFFSLFLSGLSLHLKTTLYRGTWKFFSNNLGTCPLEFFLSNLASGQLKTYPVTSYGHFWNMSIFGDYRAIWNFAKNGCLQKIKDILNGALNLQYSDLAQGAQVRRLMMGPFLVVCNTLMGPLWAIKLASLVFQHICDGLKSTWHWLIWYFRPICHWNRNYG